MGASRNRNSAASCFGRSANSTCHQQTQAVTRTLPVYKWLLLMLFLLLAAAAAAATNSSSIRHTPGARCLVDDGYIYILWLNCLYIWALSNGDTARTLYITKQQ